MNVPVYDIQNCGPRHRFMANNKLVHNSDKINLQNLPSRGPNGKKLKNTIRAPKGYVIVDGDLSQIEARIVAWLAGQTDLVDAFARGDDVYKFMASKIYGVKPEDVTGEQRFIGKMTILGCISEGTPVLCERGWVNIEQVTHKDKLWDGDNWVCHQGLVKKGLKETQSLCGSWLTPDHKVLCGGIWIATASVAQNENMISLALARGAENLPSWAMSKAQEGGLKLSSSNVSVGFPSTQSTNITSRLSSLLDVTSALKKQVIALGRNFGSMPILSPTMTNALGYSTEYPPLSADATTQTMPIIRTTGAEVFLYHKSGATIELNSSNTLSRSKVGIYQNLKWIGLTITEGMKKATYGLFQGQKTCATNEVSATCNRKLMTYDIAYAGPNNRFTIWTEKGPMIVHNCGYGMGAERFSLQIKAQANVDVPLSDSRMIVHTYRSTNFRVKQLWSDANDTIAALARGDELPFGKKDVLEIDADRRAIMLPNGLPMYYNGLHVMSHGQYGPEYGVKTRNGVERIYGGKVTENCCIAEDTEVLTDSGWKAIQTVSINDKVHDGVEFVKHSGLLFKGVKQCTTIDGVKMTPDHEVLDELQNWVEASQNPRPYRPDIRLSDGTKLCVQQERKNILGVPLSLREDIPRYKTSFGGDESRTKRVQTLMRLRNKIWEVYTRYEQTPRLRSVPKYDGQVQVTYASGLAQLRSAWGSGMQKVEEVREFLGRHGTYIQKGFNLRQGRQQQGVFAGKLPVGYSKNAGEQHTCESFGKYPKRQIDCESSVRSVWNRTYYNIISPFKRLVGRSRCNSTSRLQQQKPVYDLMNCGPRSRFVVKGNEGPFIVHNCQALAKIVISDQMLLIQKRYPVVLTVHDSVGALVPEEEAMDGAYYVYKCLRHVPDWAAGLPLDCEVGYHKYYGSAGDNADDITEECARRWAEEML